MWNRDRRPPTYVTEDFSEIEDVMEKLAETPEGDLSELTEGADFTVVIADVDWTINIPPTSTLFQQASY